MRAKKKKVSAASLPGGLSLLALFEAHVREWMRLFGLGDWTVTFEYMKSRDHRAEVSYNHVSRQAVFGLSRVRVPSRDLWLSALHEVCHVLFADLSGMAEESRNTEVVLREEHRMIARIENFVLGMGKL